MKIYTKLLGKCIAVMAPLVLLLVYFPNFMINYIDGEAPSFIWNKRVSNTPQDKYYDVVVLGDSVSNAAYVPEELSDSTINLALSGNGPLENYYTMQNWLEHNAPPKICYISFMDIHFQSLPSFWKRDMYFHQFSLKNSMAMLEEAADAGKTKIWNEQAMWDFISYELWLPNKYITAFMNGSFNQRRASNIENTTLTALHGGRFIGSTTKEYSPETDQVFDTFTVNPLYDRYYKKLIKLCIENNIQVRLIRLPMPENCLFTDKYHETFYAYYDALQEEYPGITVDWFPLYENSDFYDRWHMNSYGALRFSTELKKLYPEDFGDEPLTSDQIAGVDEYIKQEIDPRHIFDWVAGQGYTVLLYDDQNIVPTLYGDKIDTAVSDVPLAVTPLDADGIYAVTDGGVTDVTVTQAEDGTLTAQFPDGKPMSWAVKAGADMSVFVIDGFGRAVCAKSFNYLEGPEFTLIS